MGSVAAPTRTAPAASPSAAPVQQNAPARKLHVPVPRLHKEVAKPLAEIVRRRDHEHFREMFEDLVNMGVSDVHIQRSKLNGTLTVEARLDGTMQLVHSYRGAEAVTIHNALKTGSGMTSGFNIVPEDGSYEVPIDGYPYRARVATLPLFDGGEELTFRLPQTGQIRGLDELGFTDDNLDATKALLNIPGGMVVFAGPTGEGKSMTALSSLLYLRELEDGVFITLEDPVERVVPGFKQVQVRQDVEGADFAAMMKYVVRSDPNVLFVGEIRDRATASAAVEIAKSGIRVIATIHAKNNISGFMRLVKMADEDPLSVLESVNGIVSQRLVPRLVEGSERFAGRYPIHEVTQNSEALTDALIENASRRSISAAAAGTSTTFNQNVEELVLAGVTTAEAARKVVRDV